MRVPFSREARTFALATMEKVVAEGTGRRARIDGLRVGGKTGTSEGYGENKGKYDSSFVGFAPADDPRLLVLVVAHHPKRADGLRPYGGVVAAPAVKEILQRGYPLLDRNETRPLTGSGVRHSCSQKGKVRVAAVQDSSVLAGERISPVVGRNPDSVGGQICRSDR